MFRAFLLLFMLILHANQPAAALERSTPEAQGISSRAILGFVDAAEDSIDALHSFMLLRMNTGHLKEQADAFWSTERDTWAESFLAVPVGLKPGTHFVYNTGATYMAGLMVQRLTGGTLIDYLTPRLFAPLGIEGAIWQSDDEGYNVGGWGLRIRTEDIARFGQLLLQRGMWDGRRLLPDGGHRPADRGRHLQREALLLRDALPPPADFPLRRRPAALRHGVQRRLWGDEVGRADRHGADGRES